MQNAFHLAINNARSSKMLYRHGAVLCTKSGKVINHGVNNPRSHMNRLGKQKMASCHAEVQTLLKTKYCEK